MDAATAYPAAMDDAHLVFRILRIVTIVAAVAALASLAGCLSYRALLFQHGSATLPGVRSEAVNRGLLLWPADGTAYRGLVSAHPLGTTRGTIVVFHGNAGLAAYRLRYVQALEPLGFRVVLAEYPGYGARAGALNEASLIRDGVETAEAARAAFGGPLYLWGESMGCAVAAGVAAQLKTRAAGLVMLTPWDNLPVLAAHLHPALPTRLFVRDRYDNAASLAAYGGPAAFLIAEQDEVIPVEHSKRLFAGYTGPKKLWLFPDSGHNSWPDSPIAAWWQEVMSFLGPPASH